MLYTIVIEQLTSIPPLLYVGLLMQTQKYSLYDVHRSAMF